MDINIGEQLINSQESYQYGFLAFTFLTSSLFMYLNEQVTLESVKALINVYKVSKKLMPLVHLPVQTGSDKILNSMNRKHTIKEYLETFYKLKDIVIL